MAKVGRDVRQLWDKCRRNVGENWRDVGKIWGRRGRDVGDLGAVWGRCGGKMWERCWKDVAEMLERCRTRGRYVEEM